MTPLRSLPFCLLLLLGLPALAASAAGGTTPAVGAGSHTASRAIEARAVVDWTAGPVKVDRSAEARERLPARAPISSASDGARAIASALQPAD